MVLRSSKKKWTSMILAGAIILTQTAVISTQEVQVASAAVQETKLTLVKEQSVTSGAVLKNYVWESARSGKAFKTNAQVIELDLTNPYVQLQPMAGEGNQLTRKQTVLEMAKETKAAAGVNGDFYDTKAEGAPIGPQIYQGQWISSPSYVQGMYTFAIDHNNKPMVDRFSFTGKITAVDGVQFPISGINKTYSWLEPNSQYSHADTIYLYTSAWGQPERTQDGVTTVTEVLVQNNVVTQIANDSTLDMMVPADGYIMRAHGKGAAFVRDHLKLGDIIAAEYRLVSQTTNTEFSAESFKMMIGGHTILVDNGQPAAFSRSVASLCCTRSRTAVGFSQDMTKVYLITADYAGESKGLSMQELQQLMVKLGVWKGINLDGGGSTQMVARPLGDFQAVLVNQPENGSQRKVVNGLGVFSTAPQGKVKGLFINDPGLLFLNEAYPFSYKAYDEYYNPVDTSKLPAQWSVSDKASGAFNDNIFTPLRSGKVSIKANIDLGQASAELEVAGRDQLAKLQIHVDQIALMEGGSYRLRATAETVSGKKRQVPAGLIQWELIGLEGEVKDDVLTVSKLGEAAYGQVIAEYDGYRTMAVLPFGHRKTWYDLDQQAVMTLTEVKPAEVKASVSIVKDEAASNKYLELFYDFTEGQGNKWAYAALDTNVPVSGEPRRMNLRVLGDESLNWLRAEIKDNAGTIHYVDLARNVNWSGWKEISVDLTDYKPVYPIRLKSIYLVNEEIKQDEQAQVGRIGIDDIEFVYQNKIEFAAKQKISLTVNQTKVSVSGKQLKLDQAPVIQGGHTLVPIRFVTEALGGEIRWDDKERKVTIILDDKLVDLWIGQEDIIVNGSRIQSPKAPVIMNNLTMVPLRILSENLGWKVTWDAKNQQITLQ